METTWLQISAGKGPDECALAVAHVVREILSDGAGRGLSVTTLEAEEGGRKGTLASALVSVKGEEPDLRTFLAGWQGTIQWICESPYRPRHKRKNWFVSVNALMPLAERQTIRDSDLKVETMRASGPGGQHVNRTDSAVRITHLPSGLTASAQEERSQHMNRKLALSRLHAQMQGAEAVAKGAKDRERWQAHADLERGNAARVFVGPDFREKNRIR